jgi:hypothetical protein
LQRKHAFYNLLFLYADAPGTTAVQRVAECPIDGRGCPAVEPLSGIRPAQ